MIEGRTDKKRDAEAQQRRVDGELFERGEVGWSADATLSGKIATGVEETT